MGHHQQPICIDVRSWLLSGADQEQYHIVAAWSSHIATCDHCRGALMVLATSLLGHPSAPASVITCGTCQRDLPAYVDMLRTGDAKKAAECYPDVWWHLWTCAECSDTFQLMNNLAHAEQCGDLHLLEPLSPRVRERNPLYSVSLHVPRMLLARIFTASAQVGAARGSDHDGVTLADDSVQCYSLRVAVSDIRQATCCLTVTSEPPAQGRVVLRVGDVVLHADFDRHGVAQIAAFPLSLLRATDGPDLVISLEDSPHDETLW